MAGLDSPCLSVLEDCAWRTRQYKYRDILLEELLALSLYVATCGAVDEGRRDGTNVAPSGWGLAQYCLLKLPGMVNIEELASTERKNHALVVFLQLIVDLGRHEGRKFSLGERVIFVKSLTMTPSC